MKKTAILLLVICCAVAISAQTPPPPQLAAYPDIVTPQTNAGVALMSYKGAVEQNIATTFQLEQGDAAAIATLNTTVTGLQNQLNTQAAQISALQAKLSTITPAPVTTNTITWTGLPDGPLNGLYQGVNFGTGFWCVRGGELAPCADGQPTRAFLFSAPVTIVSFTFSTTTAATTGVTLTAQPSGNQVSQLAAGINQDSTFTPGWSAPISGFTVGALPSTGNAPDLRIRSLSYKG